MAGSYLVEAEAMAGLIRKLSSSAEQISTVTNKLTSASAADLGSDDLDGAARDFQDEWSYGIGKIAEATKAITGKLQSAKAAYEKVDHEAAANLKGAGGGGAGSAPVGATAQPPSGSKISNVLDAGAPPTGGAK